jgi:hypothetical protein
LDNAFKSYGDNLLNEKKMRKNQNRKSNFEILRVKLAENDEKRGGGSDGSNDVLSLEPAFKLRYLLTTERLIFAND